MIPRALVFLIAMCFALSCNAQAQPAISSQQPVQQSQALPSAVVKEALPEGEYIVAINGVELRTLTAEHARRIKADKEDLERLRRTRVALENQIAIYEKSLMVFKDLVAEADKEADEERAIALGFKRLYEGEQKLRLSAEKLYAPRGKIDAFFEHPIVKLTERIGKPIFESWLAARDRRATVVMSEGQFALLQTQWNGPKPALVLRQ